MKVASGIVVLTLLLAACGDDGDSELSGEEQALADAIAAEMLGDPDNAASAQEAQCYGEGVVEAMGLERLVEARAAGRERRVKGPWSRTWPS